VIAGDDELVSVRQGAEPRGGEVQFVEPPAPAEVTGVNEHVPVGDRFQVVVKGVRVGHGDDSHVRLAGSDFEKPCARSTLQTRSSNRSYHFARPSRRIRSCNRASRRGNGEGVQRRNAFIKPW
jgi:hypothetical protein